MTKRNLNDSYGSFHFTFSVKFPSFPNDFHSSLLRSLQMAVLPWNTVIQKVTTLWQRFINIARLTRNMT